MLVLYILLTLVGTGIVWVGSDLLEGSSERLATHYGLPPIVQGAVIAAIGSSFPEFSSTVLSTAVHGEFELGVGIITGSAIFNILVIPGICGLVAKESLETNRDLVYKEAQFYMLSVASLLLVFSFAVIYHPTEHLHGNVTRGLALFPLGLYCLYVFLQYMDTVEFEAEGAGAEDVWKEWGRLLLGMLLILVGVEGLVRAALAFGRIFNTPSFLWGVTVMAVATSIPDTFVSVKAARGGRALPSLSNVLGSNIFDLLVCIPAGILIAGATAINFSVAAPLLGFLVIATVGLFVFTRTHLQVSRLESVLLILFYGVFLAWMTLETMGITSYIQ
ncbi:MAG: sodium:calcium antiporter [Planctomycetota bacterium]